MINQVFRQMIQKHHYPILAVQILSLAGFSWWFLRLQNYEFLLYVGVILFFLILIIATIDQTRFSNTVLWGLTLWALMHMAGGGIPVGDGRLYDLILWPISEDYPIFRYDQLVHIVGFGVATLAMYELLKPLLKPLKGWTALSIVVVMAGLGVGALNEILEFSATVLVPETGVGGYVNTSLDLVADLVGAVVALVWIRWRAQDNPSAAGNG